MKLTDLPSYGLPDIIKINDRISYIPACKEPLSADVAIIRGDSRMYLYDVGSTVQCLNYLYSLPDDKTIIISHFHADHTWWLEEHRSGDIDMSPDDHISTCYERPAYSHLYVSKYTSRHTGGEIVTEPLVIEDGVKLTILPIPSPHCKGSLALLVNDEIAFLGDATYGAERDGAIFYNPQLLQAQIEFLENLPAAQVFLSHEKRPLKNREVLIRLQKSIYSKYCLKP